MGAESIMKFVVEKLKELPVLVGIFVVERKKEMGAESIMKLAVEKLKELPVLLENFVVKRKKEMEAEKRKKLLVLLGNFVGNLVDKKLLIPGLGLVVLCYCCSGSCRGGPGGRGVKMMKAPGRDIINERGKLKETKEYKRAMEEEWTSRQRQLQLQAEEVQRLRKRRKAENKRLLDMERRQKQRVQEMRETQIKHEENMNMKEKLRLEVRKELDKLEMTCSDMASLLRSLEVHVGGGFCPSSNEVHAAYKRALLKFHPDRVSRTDIYRQVEAEEKFKLISRMKEKFLLPS